MHFILFVFSFSFDDVLVFNVFFWENCSPSLTHMVVFQWLLESIIILAKKIRECVLLYIFVLQKSVILDKFLVKKTSFKPRALLPTVQDLWLSVMNQLQAWKGFVLSLITANWPFVQTWKIQQVDPLWRAESRPYISALENWKEF